MDMAATMNADDTGGLGNAALISLGRIEARLDAMSEKESRSADRLDRLEQGMTEVKSELSVIKAQAKPKTPWWVIVGGLAAVVTTLIGFWTLFNLASDLAVIVP